LNDTELKKIAEKVLAPSTLKHEITPLYTDASMRWHRTVVLPYGGAYNAAYDAVMAAVKAQVEHYDEIEKLKFELTMAALAIAGGSLLTAVYADSALKVAVKENALDFVCRNEMQKTFNAMAFVASNPVPSFIAGKVWDAAEAQALGKAKQALEPRAGQYKSLGQTLAKPWQVRENIEKFNLELRERGIDTLWAIRNLPIGDDARLRLVSETLKSKYLTPPTTEIDKATLTPKIELTLYMQVLTASDKTHYERVGRRMRHTPGYRPKNQGPKEFYADIGHSAHSGKYPSADSGVYTRGNVYNTTITMPGVGNTFMRSVDAAHKKVLQKDFFTTGEYWDWSFTGNEVKSIIKRAETTLQALAQDSFKGMLERRGH
jgi:hypothetical protein